jgi:hypothetical protein
MFRAKHWALVSTVGFAIGLSTGSIEAAELDLSGSVGVCRDATGFTCAQAGFADLGGGLYAFAGALWTVTTQQPTGSGYIDSFLRIKDQSGNDYYVVDGHNTSAPSQQYVNDEHPGSTFTHDVLSTDLQTTPIGGTDYYRFLLDINQTGTDPLLSLSGLQICTAGTGSLLFDGTCANSATAGASTSVMKYDLDMDASNYPDQTNDPNGNYNNHTNTRPAGNSVLLDYSKNSGSGSGDLWVYIPKTTLFPDIPGADITATNDYLYLWSQFGLPAPYNNNDGYEEWAFMHRGSGTNEFQPLPGVPEPATLVMLGTGLLIGGGAIRRRNRRQAAQK